MPSTMNYNFKVISPEVEFDNEFSSDKFVSIGLNSTNGKLFQSSGSEFLGNLQTLRIQGTADFQTIQPSDSKGIVVVGYRDEAGTELMLEPTVGYIYPDITGGKHSAVFSLDLIINLAPSDVLYLFIKTTHIKADGSAHSAGATDTFSVSELEVTCRRN